MNDVEIFEQELKVGGITVGKFAILRGGLTSNNPTGEMSAAVETYVGYTPYNEFVEITLDNPWVRVIVSGINDFDYKKFNEQRL